MSALRDRLDAALRAVLRDRQGLPASRAECAIDELDRSLGEQDVADAVHAAASRQRIPQAVLDAAFAAGQRCARR